MRKSSKPKKWIQAADLEKGAFTKKAKAADMTVGEYATKVLSKKSKATEETKSQARLARTFRKHAKQWAAKRKK